MQYKVYSKNDLVAVVDSQAAAADIIGVSVSTVKRMIASDYRTRGYSVVIDSSNSASAIERDYNQKTAEIRRIEVQNRRRVLTESRRFPQPLKKNILKCRFVQYGGDDRCNKCYLSTIATLDECSAIDCDGGYFMKAADLQETNGDI